MRPCRGPPGAPYLALALQAAVGPLLNAIAIAFACCIVKHHHCNSRFCTRTFWEISTLSELKISVMYDLKSTEFEVQNHHFTARGPIGGNGLFWDNNTVGIWATIFLGLGVVKVSTFMQDATCLNLRFSQHNLQICGSYLAHPGVKHVVTCFQNNS